MIKGPGKSFSLMVLFINFYKILKYFLIFFKKES